MGTQIYLGTAGQGALVESTGDETVTLMSVIHVSKVLERDGGNKTQVGDAFYLTTLFGYYAPYLPSRKVGHYDGYQV